VKDAQARLAFRIRVDQCAGAIGAAVVDEHGFPIDNRLFKEGDGAVEEWLDQRLLIVSPGQQ
jgi:hypothetical protein